MAANNYPWYLIDACGDIVANFEREDVAYACRRYFDNFVRVEYRT